MARRDYQCRSFAVSELASKTALPRLRVGLRWGACFALVVGGWCSATIVFAVDKSEPAKAAAIEEVVEPPRVTPKDVPPIVEAPITSEQREHWAFRPLARPAVPEVTDVVGCRTPIDRFIVARLDKEKLQAAPAADRATLLRRMTLDLIGLPPSPEEIAEFAADASPDAIERVADRLLSSPEYGRHIAQSWLDLARFAETDGFEHDQVRPNAWRYRDWVIAALNADMPYSRFVTLQLAGDEVAPGDPQAAVATGFCLAGPDMPDINSVDERRHVLLNDIAATVGSTLLGLQMGCAQCHDHKYDPISQADFYRLRACFENGVRLVRNRPVDALGRVEKPIETHVAVRGDYRRPGAVVLAAAPRIADGWPGEPPTEANAKRANPLSRSALAAWATDGENPLAMRVAVNRVWQQHFGEGLSRTPSDFGAMGDEPEHLQLLDWLAREFVRRGQCAKAMRRMIVASAVYRRASRIGGVDRRDTTTSDAVQANWRHAQSADAANRLWWKYPRRRLSAEMLRDAMLAVSGSLNRAGGGPGVMQPLPDEVTATVLPDQWKASPNAADHFRRSVYLFARRNLRDPLFDAFDRPDGNQTCPVRNRSVTPTQSLELFNSRFSLQAATRLADVVARESDGDAGKLVQAAYLRAYGRSASEAEAAAAEAFLQQQKAGAQQTQTIENSPKSIFRFCLALLNSSEFLVFD
jgi:hypothetical protein